MENPCPDREIRSAGKSGIVPEARPNLHKGSFTANPERVLDAARTHREARGPMGRRAVLPLESPQAANLSVRFGVRRDTAALSSGCKPHPATAPAGSIGAVMEVTK